MTTPQNKNDIEAEKKMPVKRLGKLGSQPVLAEIAELARSGLSLAEICSKLASETNERTPILASRDAVRKRLLEMGVTLKFAAPAYFSALGSVPSTESVEAARRSSAKGAAHLLTAGPARKPAWLSPFETDIKSALTNSEATLDQVWDSLAVQFSSISPQLARAQTKSQKTQAIYKFISAQAEKAKRKNNMNWARTYIELGRHALASTPTEPVDAPGPAPAPVPNKIPISMPAAAGKSFSEAVKNSQALPANTDNAALQAQLKSQGDGHSITSNMPPKRVLGERAGYSSGSTDPEAILRAELGPDAK